MRISEIAERAGVTIKTVRYYESLGLVAPARLTNGYREYTDQDVRLVREIRELGALGIRAERTRPFLDCLATGQDHVDDCPASLAGYRDAITDITARIDALTRRRTALVERLRDAAYRNSTARNTTERTAMTNIEQLPPNLPAPEDDGAAAHLPGLPSPPVALTATSGETVRLDALGAGRTVLYIYPLTGRPDVDMPDGWDAIPGARGCTPEACGFRDHHRDLVNAGASRVFGLSSQDTDYQREVVDRLRLPFAMLSDPDFRLAAALNLPTFTAMDRTLYKRLTLIIRDGRIEHVFYPVFPPDEHAHRVLEWLTTRPSTP